MAYITISNSKKIIQKLNAEELDRISEELYKRDIYFFSTRERANLKGIRELFKDPENFSVNYYKPIEIRDSLKYVFAEKQPSYHKDNACLRLNSNYKNYEIPIPIREKGLNEVLNFRDWFIKNNCQLMGAKDYIFALQRKFPYVGAIDPKTIEKVNSGVEEKENYTIESLESKIDKLLTDCDDYFNNNPNLRALIARYQKWTFLAYTYGPIDNNNSGLNDTQLRDFLRSYDITFKSPVKQYLIEYYRLKFNPDLDFHGLFLEKMGFKKCTHCLP